MEKKTMLGWYVVALAAIVIMVVSTANGVEASISCDEAVSKMLPCKPFLAAGGDPKPSPPCCEGMKQVIDLPKSKEDRQALCECVKNALAAIRADPRKVEALPKICVLTLPFPIKPDVHCSKI